MINSQFCERRTDFIITTGLYNQETDDEIWFHVNPENNYFDLVHPDWLETTIQPEILKRISVVDYPTTYLCLFTVWNHLNDGLRRENITWKDDTAPDTLVMKIHSRWMTKSGKTVWTKLFVRGTWNKGERWYKDESPQLVICWSEKAVFKVSDRYGAGTSKIMSINNVSALGDFIRLKDKWLTEICQKDREFCKRILGKEII